MRDRHGLHKLGRKMLREAAVEVQSPDAASVPCLRKLHGSNDLALHRYISLQKRGKIETGRFRGRRNRKKSPMHRRRSMSFHFCDVTGVHTTALDYREGCWQRQRKKRLSYRREYMSYIINSIRSSSQSPPLDYSGGSLAVPTRLAKDEKILLEASDEGCR